MTGYQISEMLWLLHWVTLEIFWRCGTVFSENIPPSSRRHRQRHAAAAESSSCRYLIVDIIRYLINRTFASHSPHPVWPVVWQPGTWHHDGWNIWHMNSSIHSVILSLYSLLCIDRCVCVGRGNSLGEIMTFWTLSDVSPPISAAVGDYNYRVHWLLELSVAQCSSVYSSGQ